MIWHWNTVVVGGRASREGSRHVGFTLVELLVSMGIVAALVALGSMAYSKAIAKSQNAVCLNNLKQLGLGCLFYASDHNSQLMQTDNGGSWLFEISPYLGDDNVVLKDIQRGVYRCPQAKRLFGADNLPTTYAINITTAFSSGAYLAQATHPSLTLLLADGRAKGLGGYVVTFNSQNQGYYHNAKNEKTVSNGYYNPDGASGGFFLDGHVAFFRFEDYTNGTVSNGLQP